MRIIFLGTDRSLFTSGSAVSERMKHFGALTPTDSLSTIVFSTRAHGVREAKEIAPNVHAYPTSSVSRLLYGWDALRIARRFARPDVISAQDPFETGLAAFFMARALKAPFVVEIHTDFLSPAFGRHSFLNRVRLLIARFVLSRASGYYAVSETLEKGIKERYRLHAPSSTLPIFADLQRFASIVRAKEDGALLWVGRFEAEKNPMLALSALAALRATGIDANLTMLGSGRLFARLRAYASELGLAGSVTFPGWTDSKPYLARTELMLATSRFEGYGMAIVEALAARVPVLSTDVGVARAAGAVIAGPDFAESLIAWFSGARAAGTLARMPYADEAAYLRAVREFYTRVAHSRI